MTAILAHTIFLAWSILSHAEGIEAVATTQSIEFLGFEIDDSTDIVWAGSAPPSDPTYKSSDSLIATVRVGPNSEVQVLTHFRILTPGQYWQPRAWTWSEECLEHPRPELGNVIEGAALKKLLPLINSKKRAAYDDDSQESEMFRFGERTCQEIAMNDFEPLLDGEHRRCLRSDVNKVHLHAVDCQWDSRFPACSLRVRLDKALQPGIWKIRGRAHLDKCTWAMNPPEGKYHYAYYSMYMGYPESCEPTLNLEQEENLIPRLQQVLEMASTRLKENWGSVVAYGKKIGIEPEWPKSFPNESGFAWELDGSAQAVIRLASVPRKGYMHVMAVEVNARKEIDGFRLRLRHEKYSTEMEK